MVVRLAALAIALTATPIADTLFGHAKALGNLFIGVPFVVEHVELTALIRACALTHGIPPV